MAKTVTVKVNHPFFDKIDEFVREPGQETGLFETTQERFEEMKANLPDGYVELVENEVDATNEVAKTSKKSKKKAEE